MKVVFIGANHRIADMAAQSCRMGWPDLTPLVATTAAEGLKLVKQVAPDLVILHPDFPDMCLSETVTGLRRLSNVPMLVLGHQRDEMELVTILELGADDYVRLPCGLAEITLRILAVLRRSGAGGHQTRESPLISGMLLMAPTTCEVFVGRKRIQLTATEFRLLQVLVNHQGAAVSHATLKRMLWGEAIAGSGVVAKQVQGLRRKLSDNARQPRWIANVRGVGYRFIGPASEEAAA